MIVQITLTRDELFLIKEMLPQWKKYADGFVFMVDRCSDGTYEFLMANKEKYNILDVLQTGWGNGCDDVETDARQRLYDTAMTYSNKIICLDTDEYLDGYLSKEELERYLDHNRHQILCLPWIQYTGKNTIRVDGPWRLNYKDRVGSYASRELFRPAVRHSEHIPAGSCSIVTGTFPALFIAHLQWLDKPTVAVKQYYWKISDFVAHIANGIDIIDQYQYDLSVNNFQWEYSNIEFPLKVDENIFQKNDLRNSFKYKFIREAIEKYDIPPMNDWGMGIHSGEMFK